MQIQFEKQACKWATAPFRTLIDYTLNRASETFALFETWSAQGLEPAVEVLFVGAEEIKAINQETRGIDAVTDVLSFPFLELKQGELLEPLGVESIDPEQQTVFLGDIVLCLDRAEEQAEAYGHSLQREVAFLTLHSLLHLMGYDHVDGADQAEEMEALQNQLLEQLAIDREASGEQIMQQIQREWLERPTQTVQPQPASDGPIEGLNEKRLAQLRGDGQTDEAFKALLAELRNPDASPHHPADWGEAVGSQAAQPEGFRSGFVTLIGRPNAGKSTLLNALSGQPLAIVTRKAQTTRHNIRAIYNLPHAQLILTDTPGLHKPETRLGEYMQGAAWKALRDCDLAVLLVDATKPGPTAAEEACFKRIRSKDIPLFVALTKVDRIDRQKLLPLIELYSQIEGVQAVVPISALTGEGLSNLIDTLVQALPEGPRYYSEEAFTDQSERQLVAELVREQILIYTHEEVPHGTAVQVESFEEEEGAGGSRQRVRIHAAILCDKDSHKGILIGKQGQTLKRVGQSARLRIEALLGCPVYLKLHVKVRPDWRNRRGMLNDLGYQAD